ncbi:unnamed protein product [Gongylonema pulchrum]|uniref:Cadherin domain-containing protein n=1 Tax=Gongylonema pulchrum TaxID=637853 RepID=A0A183F1H2_9BILA|nr:unnamed protein product [Gongylonema pulchrum]
MARAPLLISGDVQVITPFDFEKMQPELRIFDLILTAGHEPYETTAVLRIEIVDLTIPENSRPGTILFEVHVSDPDYLYGKTGVFKYALSGSGAANFQVKEVNNILLQCDFHITFKFCCF